MTWITITLLLLLSLYTLRPLFHLFRNIRLARKTGLPYYIFPVSEVNVLWLGLLETRLVPYIIENWIPANLADYVYDSGFKFRWTVKDRLKRKYGGVYLIATPGTLSCQVSDAEVVAQVCRQRQRFPKPSHQYEGMEIYGSNVLTSEEKEWTRHRRYTQSSFNEKNNALVWQESIRQVTEMIAHWADRYSRDSTHTNLIVPSLHDDITKLTLNIFCGAGFGVHLPFKPSLETAEYANGKDQFKDSATPPPGYDFTFRSVTEYIGPNLTSIFLTVGILPKWLSRILQPIFKTDLKAYHNLGKYLRALITMSENEENNAHNLLAGLVRSRKEEQEKEKDTGLKHDTGLSDQEILGNLFMFTIAGHETSSTSTRFALVLLALHQDIQEEMYEGIKEALAGEPEDLAEWDYARIFPKLIAPICVMLETLRLYPPVVTLPKWTSHTPAPITHNNKTYTLPPHVPVSLNANALHYSAEYWGPDVTTFSPWRWDKRNADSFLAKNDGAEGLSVAGLEWESVHKPVRGAFIPFSDGSRACMGKKFAEVEFVAALTVVFARYRVMLADEGIEARERAERALRKSSAFLTLGMKDDVPLLFQRRL